MISGDKTSGTLVILRMNRLAMPIQHCGSLTDSLYTAVPRTLTVQENGCTASFMCRTPIGGTTMQGTTVKVAVLNLCCGLFIFRIGRGPRGKTPTNLK